MSRYRVRSRGLCTPYSTFKPRRRINCLSPPRPPPPRLNAKSHPTISHDRVAPVFVVSHASLVAKMSKIRQSALGNRAEGVHASRKVTVLSLHIPEGRYHPAAPMPKEPSEAASIACS